MGTFGLRLLRVGLGVTFLWIGILILRGPELWGTGFIQPWALKLLPVPIASAMISTAWLDIVVGVLLIIGVGVGLASAVAVAHLIVVLVVSGFNETTVRDIGLLAAAVAIFLETTPRNLPDWLRLKTGSERP